jgi:hypothetical protein
MKKWACIALLLLVSATHSMASQDLPAVQTLRKMVTLEGLGTCSYWVTGQRTPQPESVLKVRQADGSDKLYYVPPSYHPNDFFQRDVETLVVITGSLTVRDGKTYLFPYSGYEKRP